MNHRYRFQTRWVVDGSPEEVSAVLEDPLQLPRWWPSVYLAVESIEGGFRLHTRGWLPYTLRWSFRITAARPPHGFSLRAWGDLEGEGEWRLSGLDADRCEVLYDWSVAANKPLLRWLSPLLKPFFAANHRWAMEQGRISLELELRRRRGEVAPPPPAPVRWRWPWFR